MASGPRGMNPRAAAVLPRPSVSGPGRRMGCTAFVVARFGFWPSRLAAICAIRTRHKRTPPTSSRARFLFRDWPSGNAPSSRGRPPTRNLLRGRSLCRLSSLTSSRLPSPTRRLRYLLRTAISFIQAVARQLDGREIGDGAVHRAIATAFQAFWRPPDIVTMRVPSRWNRAEPRFDHASKR